MDCKFDTTDDVRRIKFLNVIDEHSRRLLCLVIRVVRRCKAKCLTTMELSGGQLGLTPGPDSYNLVTAGFLQMVVGLF